MSVRELYYDPSTGFISADKLYVKLKANGYTGSKKDVIEFVRRQETAQINKPIRKPRQYDTIASTGVFNSLQMDVVVYDRYSHRGYAYIFNVIDVFSRKAWSYPLKHHKLEEMRKLLDELFEEVGMEPNNINCDNEFNKISFTRHYPQIKFWFSDKDDYVKNAIVERFNRTLTGMLAKVRTATGDNDWPQYLELVVDNYNNTVHRTIRTTPNKAFAKRINYQDRVVRTKARFAVGDKVRHVRPPATFTKGDRPSYSESVYTVEDVNGKSYKLAGLRKRYKDYELISGDSDALEKKKAIEYLKRREEARKAERRFAREGIEKQAVLGRRVDRKSVV